MNVYVTQAKEGDVHPFQIAWTDELGRPLAVESVVVNFFYYLGGVKTAIGDANIPMTATGQSYRYISLLTIPTGYAGKLIYCEFSATLTADNTALVAEQVCQVSAALGEQRIFTTF